MMGTEGVSETNMMQYLGIIEHRANQLLQAFQIRQSKISENYLDNDTNITQASLLADGANLSVIGQGPAAPAGSVVIHVEPPLIGDEDDSAEESDEEEERPLSRDELKAKTMRGINKRKSRQPQKVAPNSARSSSKR